MNESTEQKSGKTEPEKVVAPGSNAQSQIKPDAKQDPKSIAPASAGVPPIKADAGVKPAQK